MGYKLSGEELAAISGVLHAFAFSRYGSASKVLMAVE